MPKLSASVVDDLVYTLISIGPTGRLVGWSGVCHWLVVGCIDIGVGGRSFLWVGKLILVWSLCVEALLSGDVVLVPEWRVCAWELVMRDPVVNTLPKFTPSLTLSGLTLCGAEC